MSKPLCYPGKPDSSLPRWYLERAIPRLKRIEEIDPLCEWGRIGPSTMEGWAAREEWKRLMDEQCRDEEEVGL